MKTSVKDFTRGTTKGFTATIYLNGDKPEIENDSVIFTMKRKKSDDDVDAVIQKNADVTTSGAGGMAIFNITKVETDIAPMRYYYDIQWQRYTGEEDVLTDGKLTVKDRVSDV